MHHPQHPRFLSVSVTGGFLDGLNVDLGSGTTCAIGIRGAGKTTLLELLAFAVAPADAAPSERVAGNLGSGKLRVHFEAAHRARYVVERALDVPPRVLDDIGGRPVAASVDQLIAVDYFPAHAIERAAGDVAAQLHCLDAFAPEEMRTLGTELARVQRELVESAAELDHLALCESEKREEAAEVPALEERLRGLLAETSTGVDLAHATQLAGLRQRERLALKNIGDSLRETREDATRLSSAIARRTAGLIDEGIAEGPNGDLLRGYDLTDVRAALEHALGILRGTCDAAIGRLESVSQALTERHAVQDEAYRGDLAKVQEETSRADERASLQKRLASALSARRQVEHAAAERRVGEERRRQLLARLAELRDRRFARRAAIARELTTLLAPAIRVSVTQNEDRSDYAALLGRGLRNSNMQYKRLVEKFIDVPPHELALYVRRRNHAGLAERAKVDEERARRAIDRFVDIVWDIETVELGDMPGIELFDGTYKSAATLSEGQRCTAILPILLLLSNERPLLIDQPEDNIDGAFLCDTIIRRIRDVKARRQLLFATHSANIVVLSSDPEDEPGRDAVFVLESTGCASGVVARGTVDDVKDHIQRILEGGAKALAERMRRYQ